ncbi:MAG: type II toxin-antitoxin system VapB family antitoxin [Leptospiraceae bacterium]|nr:type II toxin-antitoxin system VapB family antitoxin [Leptospiraceae bacterium]MCK6382524.1 type II toxin-antitoxin system VapB family antitoxin [Leptospiraceae bacterium]NUM41893.1 type II toxin-antitoxin system VapB family antitoxin [Leptospiraceae bacterium]
MKTSLYISDELLKEAKLYSGIEEKTRLVQEGLKALIREKSKERLILLGGSDPKAKAVKRKRRH